ncbi:hypothetical protein PR048_017068 [Dryococelus australis]|uniref:Uncharacterized protein n=1 Tax=Dryococelus australis TaxID=614101 RepID=A0ABQ9H931_9NEOP|nr:hypothetical protein PR048_017068 [Dryococelus australis]
MQTLRQGHPCCGAHDKWLDNSYTARRNGPDSRWSFVSGNRAGRCHWSGGFLRDLRFPPLFHFGATPYSPHFALISSQDLGGWHCLAGPWCLSEELTPDCLPPGHVTCVFLRLRIGNVIRSYHSPPPPLAPYSTPESGMAVPNFNITAGIQGWGKWEIPEKTRRPAAYSGTIPRSDPPGRGLNPDLGLLALRGRRHWDGVFKAGARQISTLGDVDPADRYPRGCVYVCVCVCVCEATPVRPTHEHMRPRSEGNTNHPASEPMRATPAQLALLAFLVFLRPPRNCTMTVKANRQDSSQLRFREDSEESRNTISKNNAIPKNCIDTIPSLW